MMDLYTPLERARAFCALAESLKSNDTDKSFKKFERQTLNLVDKEQIHEVYSRLVTHQSELAGPHWFLAVPLAERLREMADEVGGPLDFESLVIACKHSGLADVVARLAGFRGFYHEAHGQYWARSEGRPNTGGVVVERIFVVNLLEDLLNAYAS